MRPESKSVLIAGVLLTTLLAMDRARLIGAEEEARISHSKRGGILVATEGYQFEVFFYPTGVRVFPMDADEHPLDCSKLIANATVCYPEVPPDRWVVKTLLPAGTDQGDAQPCLVLRTGLADATEKSTLVAFEIIGLPRAAASTAAFKIPLESVARSVATAAASSTSSDSRQLAINAFVEARPPALGNTSRNVSTTVLKQSDWTTGRTNLPLARPWLPIK